MVVVAAAVVATDFSSLIRNLTKSRCARAPLCICFCVIDFIVICFFNCSLLVELREHFIRHTKNRMETKKKENETRTLKSNAPANTNLMLRLFFAECLEPMEITTETEH